MCVVDRRVTQNGILYEVNKFDTKTLLINHANYSACIQQQCGAHMSFARYIDTGASSHIAKQETKTTHQIYCCCWKVKSNEH